MLKEVSLEKIKQQLVEAAADDDHLLELELPELLKKQLKEEMYDCWGGAWYLSVDMWVQLHRKCRAGFISM